MKVINEFLGLGSVQKPGVDCDGKIFRAVIDMRRCTGMKVLNEKTASGVLRNAETPEYRLNNLYNVENILKYMVIDHVQNKGLKNKVADYFLLLLMLCPKIILQKKAGDKGTKCQFLEICMMIACSPSCNYIFVSACYYLPAGQKHWKFLGFIGPSDASVGGFKSAVSRKSISTFKIPKGAENKLSSIKTVTYKGR